MRLDIKRKFTARTDRVKCVDCHPTEPWILSSLYNGAVWLWNYETQSLIKSFECSELPVRAARFITRKSWIILGGDDLQLKVFNVNTFEKVTQFEAHSDYIRSIAVHPTLSFVLTCGDDLLIKLWDWDKNWKCVMTFEGHTHFVMQQVFSPKDSNNFASASLDKTIKVWNIGNANANFTLHGHSKGVNCVDYYHGNDKPYLVSGADDFTVKIWDYQNKTCVSTLEGHLANISCVAFHPELPIIITGSEDGSVKVWNSTTNKLEQSLNYGLERVWSVAYQKGCNDIALGFDEGSLVIKMGREEPAVSLDSSGKLIWARHNLVLSANLRSSVADNVKDAEVIPLQMKEMGTCEVFPQTLTHSPNGRFVVVTGDGEYIVYTALAWRNRSFGNGLEFAWSPGNEYAVREGSSRLRLYDKQFKEKPCDINLNYTVERIFSGNLLAVKSSVGFVTFYDWDHCRIVRRIETNARGVFWKESGGLLAIASEDSLYILRYHSDKWENSIASGSAAINEEGCEDAFEVLFEMSEQVKSGCWIADCFVFISDTNRLVYVIGGQVFTLLHSESNTALYLLGYVQADQRIYYCDKDVNVYSWKLPIALIDYQAAVLRGDMDTAATLLRRVADGEQNKVAQFLDSQGLLELAISVSQDDEHRFDLAIRAKKFDIVMELAEKFNVPAKWKQAAECALQLWDFAAAENCFALAKDLEGLFLIRLAKCDVNGISVIATDAESQGRLNLAFASLVSIGRASDCVTLLLKSELKSEAALMARTYAPSKVQEAVDSWRATLPEKLARQISNIAVHEDDIKKEEQIASLRQLALDDRIQHQITCNPSSFS